MAAASTQMPKQIKTIALLNSMVMTSEEDMSYHAYKISKKQAKEMLHDTSPPLNEPYTVKSYVNHPSTARLMERDLGIDVPLSGEAYCAKPYEAALCFKVKSRIPWGKELSEQELDALEYSYFLVWHTPLTDEDYIECIIGSPLVRPEPNSKRSRSPDVDIVTA